MLSTAYAQFEAGFVKILEDQRYQDGANFGNFRNQEDGIKYKEETDEFGVRRGYWEYPDETGQIQRVEFEAGPGIGFRIVNSNIVAPTPVKPLPVQRQEQQQPVVPAVKPQNIVGPVIQPQPAQVRQVPVIQPEPQQPEPQNLFDYPADLQFFRDSNGHRFTFSAV